MSSYGYGEKSMMMSTVVTVAAVIGIVAVAILAITEK